MFGRGVMFYLSEIDGSVLPSWYEGIGLGYWWRGDLLASHAVEENIQKARRSFFHFGRIVVRVTLVFCQQGHILCWNSM